MLEVIIPKDQKFQVYENQIKNLYLSNQKLIADKNSFEFIRDNTLFYLFLFNEKVIGAIYYFKKDNKLWVNAFSIRKNHLLNLKCLKLSMNWFYCDIWAKAQNKASAFCLLRIGFKKYQDNIYVYKN